MNKIIFGGTFDPIHNGHLNMAIRASKTLNADVYFVPARISVWKNESTPIEYRIKMIELAINSIKENSHLKISRVEADSNSNTNYTIDTVGKFKRMFPNKKLYLLIGIDQVNSFDKWKMPKN